MERKYLLKLEGRSTRKSIVLTASELEWLKSWLNVEHERAVKIFDGELDDFPIELISKLLHVLTYTKPCD